ncbi:MAG: alpha/beta fold hydrolase [Burkholderiales bacterium]|nr:alpha/beta fold hydrolase [Opitutaceae bacterium]
MSTSSLPAPVIFLPGIMGSTLRDEYPVSADNVWSVTKAAFKAYDRITLHPDNLNYELKEPARVVKDQVFSLFYNEIIEELRYNLSPNAETPVPVFPFAYDWRMPLADTEAALAAFITEVVERTSLLRHYHAAGYTTATGKVNLVGHSMGGLIIAGYVKERGLAKVDKVVTLASPFRGSIESIAKTTLGSSGFSSTSGSSREREAARVTPALYHLLPSYDGAVKPAKRDVYDPANWQRGIKQTLAAFIDQHSLRLTETDPAKRPAAALSLAEALLDDILTKAWDHREKLEALVLPDPTRWLSIVGVGASTRQDVKLTIHPKDGPLFELHDEVNAWKPKSPSERTGDNTVPYAGARCAFIPPEQVVCLCPDDFGFWELGGKLLNELGFHSALPSMNVAIRLTISHLLGRPQGDVWGRPSPEIDPKKWAPPIKGLVRK